jgi:hypothetical protein
MSGAVWRSRSTIAADNCRLTEWGPRTLESMWSSFFMKVTLGIGL